jgi:outer membrane protein OmpA-like peptidoglycan-associated protein
MLLVIEAQMNKQGSFLGSTTQQETEDVHWLSVSDLMAGLMMVFLFISVALIRDTKKTTRDVEDIVETYIITQEALVKGLHKEFDSDLESWGAEIRDKNLSFVFKSPDVLFDRGDITIKPRFKEILNDFFPRYLKVIQQFDITIDKQQTERKKSFIEGVRIEGHTSSIWNNLTLNDEAYFKNMWLSQGRTRSVLEYVYKIKLLENKKQWIKKHLAAVGFSSSKVIYDKSGNEDRNLSRRVEFRVVTNSEQQLNNIIERLK